jgi:hypothetical protein
MHGLNCEGRPWLINKPYCHTPRKRGIQYAAASQFIASALEYWITRWSLSSGGAPRRPGGG